MKTHMVSFKRMFHSLGSAALNIVLVLFLCCRGTDANAYPPTNPDPGGNKTFSALMEKGVFLLGGHDAYTPFADGEIKVLKVTNLDADGIGSLAWAVNQSGPRVVVFEVGGVIDMGGKNIVVKNPYLYIAGQTAPLPGITIIKGGISVSKTNDVVIRHISVRPGDMGQPKGSGWEVDGIAMWIAYNILIDHCSLTWCTDENLSASGPQHDGADKTSRCVTFRNCIVAEALNDASHSKGAHGYGSLIHDYCKGIAIVGNLYASNVERNPLFKPNTAAYISNNLIYNPKRRAIHASWPDSEYAKYPGTLHKANGTVIGNILIPGPDTPADFWLVFGKMDVFHNDNVILSRLDDADGDRKKRIISKETAVLDTDPMSHARYTPIPSAGAAADILSAVGSRPAGRDAIDRRIVEGVAAKTGKILDSQDEVGGYPVHAQTQHNLSIPSSGIQEWLEAQAESLMIR